MASYQDQENSHDVDTGMVRVFSFDAYTLLDLSATLSFVAFYVITMLDYFPQHLLKPFSMSTPIDEFILVERVYRGCTLSIYHRNTIADFVELDMVDFDFMLSIHMFYTCYA